MIKKRTFCTVITKNYLAYARVLAKTLLEHNPGSELFVLLADKNDGYFDSSREPFTLVRLEDLEDQETIHKMCFYYTAFELCCALRPFLHEYILKHTSVCGWIFFDSDIVIYHSLENIFEELEKTSILLSRHSVVPVDSQHVDPDEINFLRGGVYNAGFLGLRRTEVTQAFLEWYKQRLVKYCFNNPASGFFVDQLWLNLVPLYFKDVGFLLHPGANIGHWNLKHKKFRRDSSGKIFVNEESLLFVHFSGWDMNHPSEVSKYVLFSKEETPPLWEELGLEYRRLLLAHDHEMVAQWPYAFDYFDNGKPILPSMRRAYYEDLKNNSPHTDLPFQNYAHYKSRIMRDVSFLSRLKKFLKR